MTLAQEHSSDCTYENLRDTFIECSSQYGKSTAYEEYLGKGKKKKVEVNDMLKSFATVMGQTLEGNGEGGVRIGNEPITQASRNVGTAGVGSTGVSYRGTNVGGSVPYRLL